MEVCSLTYTQHNINIRIKCAVKRTVVYIFFCSVTLLFVPVDCKQYVPVG